MSQEKKDTKLRVAFLHPDLGIGGAERLVVDAALGLQERGHSAAIYTSHYDPNHCFEETKDEALKIFYYKPPFFLPRSLGGQGHVFFAHLRQLHLAYYLIASINANKTQRPPREIVDIFFIDQLSTAVPLLRLLTGKRVVFYCHFPDKLLSEGQYSTSASKSYNAGLLKRLYRLPMDFLEEKTTGYSDLILANSKFTARIVAQYLPSIKLDKGGFTSHAKSPSTGEGAPRIVYPGIKLQDYSPPSAKELKSEELRDLVSERPTFLSLNRFEGKKNIPLALNAFSLFLKNLSSSNQSLKNARLVLGGGFDPRLNDNRKTLNSLFELVAELGLTFALLSTNSSSASDPLVPMTQELMRLQTSPSLAQVLFLPNFSTPQRSYLLTSPHTIALLYTPENEHFGIVPIEGMAAGVPVLACNSGGPTESVIDAEGAIGESLEGADWSVVDLPSQSAETKKNGNGKRTGWLRAPKPEIWATAMLEAASMNAEERNAIAQRCRERAKLFSLDAMSSSLETALLETYALGNVSSNKIPEAMKWYLRLVGWTFCILVVIMWIVLGSWALFGTELTAVWIAGLGGWGWYKGWWLKLSQIK